MSEAPFMPKATAVWLVENTTLTFKQIAEFCNLHELEIKGIAEYISPIVGGAGCVRDVIEQTLRVQGKWADKNNLGW